METLSVACGAVALIGSHHSSLIALLKVRQLQIKADVNGLIS